MVIRPRSPRLATAAAALALTTLAACSSVGSSGSGSGSQGHGTDVGKAAGTNVKDGGTLVVALREDPDRLDPTFARSLVGRNVFAAMCEKLYDVDANTKIVPQLASALPTTSSDGKTVTIPLRTGVKFADGTTMDAAAVKKSLERDLSAKGSSRTTELGPVTSIDAKDPHTVVIHLSSPFTPLTAALADRAGMVMSPKQLDKLGDKFSSHPVCVGPFRFADRVPQSKIVLEKDPNYYDADKVHLDRLVYRIITDANIRAANLKSHDIQVADDVSTTQVRELDNTSGVHVLKSDSLGYQGLTFNVGNVNGVGEKPGHIDQPWADSAAVRRAFSYAVDRKALSKAVWDGLFAPACSAIAPGTTYSAPQDQSCPDGDPAKSRALLKQAGVHTPVTIKLAVGNEPDVLRFAQALQAQVKKGGFDLKIKPQEFTSLLDSMDAGDYQAVQIGWSGRVDPDANLTVFVGTKAALNVGGYSNPKVDALLQKARTTQGSDARAQLYAQATRLLTHDSPLVYLYRQRNLTGVSDKISGVQVFPDGLIRVAFAGFSK